MSELTEVLVHNYGTEEIKHAVSFARTGRFDTDRTRARDVARADLIAHVAAKDAEIKKLRAGHQLIRDFVPPKEAETEPYQAIAAFAKRVARAALIAPQEPSK